MWRDIVAGITIMASVLTSFPHLSQLIGNSLNANNDVPIMRALDASEVTDEELRKISQEIILLDRNEVSKYISVNVQGSADRTGNDAAPLPLLTVSPEIWNIPSFAALKHLHDNYELDTSLREDVTWQEMTEEEKFIDTIMSTDLMSHLMKFLVQKGIISSDLNHQKSKIKELWFDLYPRKRGGVESSSSFEHIFLAEIRNKKLLGFHNWIFFHLMESNKGVNYLGYHRNIDLNNGKSVLKFAVHFQDIHKPVSSMFVGTSPEFDIAVYTLCMLTRGSKSCRLNFDGKKVFIRVYPQTYNSKTYFGSAYPEI